MHSPTDRSLGYVDDQKQLLYTFHGLGKKACCYLTDLDAIARQLNERPRKALPFETPADRFSQRVATTR